MMDQAEIDKYIYEIACKAGEYSAGEKRETPPLDIPT